jgi:hypothetical protein
MTSLTMLWPLLQTLQGEEGAHLKRQPQQQWPKLSATLKHLGRGPWMHAYQHELVARPAIPVSNKFTALRIVVKNSATGQLRQAWEVPKPASRPTQISLRRQRKSQAPAEAIYKAHRTLKQGEASETPCRDNMSPALTNLNT